MGHVEKNVDESRRGHCMIEHMWQAMRDILSISNYGLKEGFISFMLIEMTVCERIVKL